jgi:hypothetical protein
LFASNCRSGSISVQHASRSSGSHSRRIRQPFPAAVRRPSGSAENDRRRQHLPPGHLPRQRERQQRGTERTLNADAIRQSGTHLKHRPSPLSHGRYLAPSDTDPSIRPNPDDHDLLMDFAGGPGAGRPTVTATSQAPFVNQCAIWPGYISASSVTSSHV